MKKIISLFLVLVMVFSVSIPVFATTDWSNGTLVSFDAEADNNGDGQPDSVEAYTVTVPARMQPGETAKVIVSGTWASNRKLVVDADDTVTLVNSIKASDKKILDVTFANIAKEGDNTVAVSGDADISVESITNALFGEWSGTITYTVEMQDVQ
jgi:hypothetical protein